MSIIDYMFFKGPKHYQRRAKRGEITNERYVKTAFSGSNQ
jgi:hypothetical protein